MLFQLKSYLGFLLKSSNHHGVHSPFVFKLLTECFYDSQSKIWYPVFQEYKRKLLKNHKIIKVEDFGAGSRKLNINKRKVSDIAKNAGIAEKRAQLLGRLTAYFKPETILEIGTSLGMATTSMYLGHPKASITTLEGCENTAAIAKEYFEYFKFDSILIEIGNFNKTLPKVLSGNTFDFIYFDGNHQKQPTIDYFELCLKNAHHNSIFIFDDIYWSKEMLEAWNYIKNHPKVTVSIDTFHWGIVSFRKEQPKQHFIIRT